MEKRRKFPEEFNAEAAGMVKMKSGARCPIQPEAAWMDGQNAQVHYTITPPATILMIQVGLSGVMTFAFFPEKDFVWGVDCA